jgi:hypothetical protein
MGSTREDKTFYLPSSTVANSSTIVINYSPPHPPLTTSESTSMGSGSTSSASSRGAANSQASSVSGGSLSATQWFTAANYEVYATDERHTRKPTALLGRRNHYRIAFADPPGRSIKDLTTPEDAFEALHGGLKGVLANDFSTSLTSFVCSNESHAKAKSHTSGH